MKKQIIIQIKEIFFPHFHSNMKLYFINWLGDNLLYDVDSHRLKQLISLLYYSYFITVNILLSVDIYLELLY